MSRVKQIRCDAGFRSVGASAAGISDALAGVVRPSCRAHQRITVVPDQRESLEPRKKIRELMRDSGSQERDVICDGRRVNQDGGPTV